MHDRGIVYCWLIKTEVETLWRRSKSRIDTEIETHLNPRNPFRIGDPSLWQHLPTSPFLSPPRSLGRHSPPQGDQPPEPPRPEPATASPRAAESPLLTSSPHVRDSPRSGRATEAHTAAPSVPNSLLTQWQQFRLRNASPRTRQVYLAERQARAAERHHEANRRGAWRAALVGVGGTVGGAAAGLVPGIISLRRTDHIGSVNATANGASATAGECADDGAGGERHGPERTECRLRQSEGLMRCVEQGTNLCISRRF